MPPAIALILNGISRKKKIFYQDTYPAISKKFELEVFETQRAGHAVELSHQAAENDFDFIVTAGGDGTLNQVVNGVLSSSNKPLPVLGLIPLGSGNDFARMCGLSTNPQSFIDLAEANQPKPVDVGRITCQNQKGDEVIRYFINACSIGMGPDVVKRLEKSDRSLGPMLTYWKAITTTFLTHRPQEIECKTPAWEYRGRIRVLAIANGRSLGNSLFIAPDASPDDGVFNTFIAGDIPFLKFLIYQQRLKSREKIKDAMITYNKATDVELSAPESCPIETEGELAGYLPARIEIIPSGIRFLR